jgi:N-acetylmuramoyl-L-alanine amidase
MDPAALAGLCSLLASGQAAGPLPPGVVCPPAATSPVGATASVPAGILADALKAPGAREGIARVAYAEAGSQGDSGLAAVVYAILNRLADGRWGVSVDAVLDARSQFEPVMRVGGDWRNLPPVSAPAQARIDTILNLALDGRLPDLTHGARYFQNPAIVAQRARDGTVSASLVNFGGRTPSAVIGAHSFYTDTARGGGARQRPPGSSPPWSAQQIFVDPSPAVSGLDAAPPRDDAAPAERPQTAALGDPSQALFVGSDGVVRSGPR